MKEKTNDKMVSKTIIKVVRTFGTHNISEIYSDYVAQKIRATVKTNTI